MWHIWMCKGGFAEMSTALAKLSLQHCKGSSKAWDGSSQATSPLAENPTHPRLFQVRNQQEKEHHCLFS